MIQRFGQSILMGLVMCGVCVPALCQTLSAGSPAESYTTLRVDTAALPSRGAVLLATSESAEFTRELLRVEWRAGDPIDLYVIRPHGVEHPPVILFLYGYPTDTSRFRDDGWCRRATAGGFAAVGFVSALTGDRYHAPRPMKQWFVSELPEALATSTHDVQRVLDYLADRKDLDMGHVGIFGQGSGGTISILASAVDSRIKALDVLDPWGDWPVWLRASPRVPETERATYLSSSFQTRVAALDPMRYLAELNTEHVRLQQVASEVITPTEAKRALAAALPEKKRTMYVDTAAQMQAWRAGGMWAWMKDQLQPGAAHGTTVSIGSPSVSAAENLKRTNLPGSQ